MGVTRLGCRNQDAVFTGRPVTPADCMAVRKIAASKIVRFVTANPPCLNRVNTSKDLLLIDIHISANPAVYANVRGRSHFDCTVQFPANS